MFHDIEQNTDEWLELRKGRFTASRFKSLFAKPQTVEYQKAIYKVALERVTGESPEEYVNGHMERGKELENEGLLEYQLQSVNIVTNPGFFSLNEWAGASPDGLIEEDGLIELKCPAYNTHINYILQDKLPASYFYQVHGQLWITDRKWCDFVSYYPGLKLFIKRIYRDVGMDDTLEQKLNESIEYTKKIIENINR